VVYLGDVRSSHTAGKVTEQVSALKHIYFQTRQAPLFSQYHGALPRSPSSFLVVSYTQQLYMEWLKGVVAINRDMRRSGFASTGSARRADGSD